jgi:hypothetical protein
LHRLPVYFAANTGFDVDAAPSQQRLQDIATGTRRKWGWFCGGESLVAEFNQALKPVRPAQL